MLGPALPGVRNDAQKAAHLPKDHARRDPLVSGLSETGRRKRSGKCADAGRKIWAINWPDQRQKIWTPMPDQADWIFALVRTDRDAGQATRAFPFLLIGQ